MNVWVARASVWLMQGGANLPDTIVTKQVAQDEGWFATVTSVASGLMSLALLVLTVFLVPAAYNFRKSYQKISKLLDRVYGDINPLVRHASTIADNVDYITTSIRVDIQQVNETIASANQRLNHAVALTEQRLNEFNALLQVVQQEAEDAFVSTAATVRGVRAGAATFREDALRPDTFPETFNDDLDDEEFTDGYDSPLDPDDRRPAPRIRPKP